ncbi:MAG: single-stranded-DNA-specific exonuclease RecJ [Candidatus Omnitrophica bacterium]|nr:single-stranded-DNA-specific exonuclease RecJ [Candidatus Omnitrophota bacterium]
MEKIWHILPSHPKRQAELVSALHIHPIVAQLLINRDIQEPEAAKLFLSAEMEGLLDPFTMKGIPEAVDRLKLARDRKEKVLIYGDYDVDGVTASALLHDTFQQYGLNVDNHIPHRMLHGYGLNMEIGEMAKKDGVSLIVTVDCGINACEAVDVVNSFGIDVIIIDHHEPAEQLPKALVIINPKQKECSYPFKDLAGVGLAAKISQALIGQITDEALDFAAIGTVADIVPLLGENRIIVKNGLKRLNQTRNKGLKALLEIAKILGKDIRPFHVGFILGPRINAAGRMDSAHDSLDLFLAQDDEKARGFAAELEKHNTMRQLMQKEVIEEALAIVEQEVNFNEDKVIVICKEGWHKGVLGIVASRITDKYFRPAVVISVEDGVGTASARSIDGFHLHDALLACSELLVRFGGHEGAAGLTIKEENIELFRKQINHIACKNLEQKKLVPTIHIDCEVALADINLELAHTVDTMEPFGEGNPEPVFCVLGVTVKSRPQVMGKETIKFWVSDDHAAISAVGFGMGRFAEIIDVGSKVDLAFNIGIDDWNKAPVAQLKLKDVRLTCQKI